MAKVIGLPAPGGIQIAVSLTNIAVFVITLV